MGEQVVSDRHRLRVLEVGVPGHHPACMRARPGSERFHHIGERRNQLRRRHPTVETQVKRDLVVARSPGVKRSASRGDLPQSTLDGRVDVFIGGAELEIAAVQLALDPAKAALDRRQSRP
jgi:hypothetical protein